MYVGRDHIIASIYSHPSFLQECTTDVSQRDSQRIGYYAETMYSTVLVTVPRPAKVQSMICKRSREILTCGDGGKSRGAQVFRRIVLAAAAAFSCFTIAAAQSISTNNVFAGYSFLGDNLFSGQHANLNGWNVSAEKKYLPFFGVVGEFAGFYGSAGPPSSAYCSSIPASRCLAHSTISEYSFSVGIRGSYGTKTIRPFGEALFGEFHTTESGMGISNVSNNFGAILGTGIDCRLTRMLGCRLVVDYIVTGNFTIARQNSVRASTGLVFRF
jgi:hypothetical protein